MCLYRKVYRVIFKIPFYFILIDSKIYVERAGKVILQYLKPFVIIVMSFTLNINRNREYLFFSLNRILKRE